MTSSEGSSPCVCRALVLLPRTHQVCCLCQPCGTAYNDQPQINSSSATLLFCKHTSYFPIPEPLHPCSVSPYLLSFRLSSTPAFLMSYTQRPPGTYPPRSTLDSFACCNEGEHSLGHCGCLRKGVSRRGLAGFFFCLDPAQLLSGLV